jgi:tetratricopeptide (TPR) repeat protein
MPQRIIPALALLLVIAGAPAAAQPVIADYVEGTVEARGGAGWEPVRIGERLAADSQVRLGEGAYAELSRGPSTIRLARSGTYRLGRLFDGARRNRSVGLAAMIRRRLEQLTAGRPQDDPTAAGVRGDDAGAGDLMWVGGEEAGELIEEGISLLAEADYETARDRFSEAYDFAESDAQAARARFYLGYVSYLEGDLRAALSTFDEVSLGPGDADYDTFVLTRAQALVETFAYADAEDLLSSYLREEPADAADRQSALLLRALARDGRGRAQTARADLTAAREIDPDSESGRMAAQLLAEL